MNEHSKAWKKRKQRHAQKTVAAEAAAFFQRIGLPVLEDRPCGSCTACCLTHPIEAIPNKLGYLPCPHQSEHGCKIHASHPFECRLYECAYRRGVVAERPDRSGIVVDHEHADASILVAELWKGAALTNWSVLMELLKLTERLTVSVYLTPEQVAKAALRQQFPHVQISTDKDKVTEGFEYHYQMHESWT